MVLLFLGRYHRIWYFHTFFHNFITSTLPFLFIFFIFFNFLFSFFFFFFFFLVIKFFFLDHYFFLFFLIAITSLIIFLAITTFHFTSFRLKSNTLPHSPQTFYFLSSQLCIPPWDSSLYFSTKLLDDLSTICLASCPTWTSRFFSADTVLL